MKRSRWSMAARTLAARLMPLASSSCMRVRRTATSANSAATKKAFAANSNGNAIRPRIAHQLVTRASWLLLRRRQPVAMHAGDVPHVMIDAVVVGGLVQMVQG